MTRKRLANVGDKAQFAAALSRAEPCARTRNFRRWVKRELSRTRRRLDEKIVRDDAREEER